MWFWLALTAVPGLALLFSAHLLNHVLIDLLLAGPLLMTLDATIPMHVFPIVAHLLDDKLVDVVLSKRLRVV